MNPERETLISTGCLGALGDLATLRQVWPSELNQVEMIAWRGRVGAILKEAEDYGYDVICIHGPSGGPLPEKHTLRDRAILWVISQIITPTPQLTVICGDKHEILVHSPNLREKRNLEAMLKSKAPFVWIENHPHGEDGTNEAIAKVQVLREENVPAGLVFDLCHFIGATELTSTDFFQRWEEAMELIANRISLLTDHHKKAIPLGIHFPIGTYKSDSLPIDKMSDDMLRDFAAVIDSKEIITRLVLECQQEGWLAMAKVMGRETVTKQRRRNEGIYDRLKKTGIV